MVHALRSPRLLPGEREALLNEALQQQHQFRQNVAMLHGLPQPEPPVQYKTPQPVFVYAPQGPSGTQDPPTPEPDSDTGSGTGSTGSGGSTPEPPPPVTPPPSTKPVTTPPVTAEEEPKKGWKTWQKVLGTIALLGGGAALPVAGNAIFGGGGDEQKPVVERPADRVNILNELNRLGYGDAPTDLGADIKKAFTLDPALRQKLLDDVKKTLEHNGVQSRDPAAGAGTGTLAPTPTLAPPKSG